MVWRHTNPGSASWVETAADRGFERREMDPLGAEVGTSDPFLVVIDPGYGDVHGGSLFEDGSDPFHLSDGCGTIDGMPASCNEVADRVAAGSVAAEVSGGGGRRSRQIALPDIGLGYIPTGVWVTTENTSTADTPVAPGADQRLVGSYWAPLGGGFQQNPKRQNPAGPSVDPKTVGQPPPPNVIWCKPDVIEAMKRAWGRTSNGLTGNEAGFVLNGNPSKYTVVDTKSGYTQNEQKMTIIPTVPGGSSPTFLLFHVHPNSSTRNPSTPENNAKGDSNFGDTLISDRYYQRGQTILFLVGHRTGLTMYDPSKPPSQRLTVLRENLDWTNPCK